MSELINKNDNRVTIRWKLLTSASALALSAYVSSAVMAKAEDASQPQIWIELGGQWDAQTGLGHTYTPSFITNNPNSVAFNPISPVRYEKPILYALGEDGKITFQPDGSDWQFSASLRYGRSSSRRSVNQGHAITHIAHITAYPSRFYSAALSEYVTKLPPPEGTIIQHGVDSSTIQSARKQTQEILDFTAGKDVGLGLFGKNGSSTLSAGVRFAQFDSNVSAIIHARPDTDFFYTYLLPFVHVKWPNYEFRQPQAAFHTNAAQFEAQREFKGVGPSISWNASMPIAGNPSDEELTVDWGINAALLFGRQRTRGEHQTSGHYRRQYANSHYTATGNSFDRSRRVTVPNVGGMLGMSLKFSNFKMSLGYRGDFFFGAMDTGNDTRKTGVTGFYGPFASISFGLGD